MLKYNGSYIFYFSTKVEKSTTLERGNTKVNVNRQKYLESILSDSQRKVLFVLRDNSKINLRRQKQDNLAVFSINDIVAIKDGNKTLYNGTDFAKQPKYTAEFTYRNASHWTVIGTVGSRYVNVDPEYKIAITDTETGKKIILNIYRVVKEIMEGKVLTPKRRELFEREFLRVIDHPDDLNIPILIGKAVEKSHI